MKSCEKCRFMYRTSYEYGGGSCELFGEDTPEWAQNQNDGCLLKTQEVKKACDISSQIRQVGTGKIKDKWGFPEFTEEDKKHNEKIMKKYNEYMKQLKERCERRSKNEKAN